MQFSIRAMRETDWPQVQEIYLAGIESGCSTFQTEVPDYSAWSDTHLPDHRFVAADGERVAGFFVLGPTSSREPYRGVCEVSIYVHPGYRHEGIGTALLNTGIKSAESGGIWTLQSVVLACNPASCALHEKAGFRQVGRREKIARDRFGIWQDTFLYEKKTQAYLPTVEKLLEILTPVRAMDGYLGLVVLGSLSAGMQDETSDYDFRVIFSDDAMRVHPQYASIPLSCPDRPMDYQIVSLSEFRAIPRDNYRILEYIHAVIAEDTTGQISGALDEITRLSVENPQKFTFDALDEYYNGVFRSLKCQRHGFVIGFHQMAAYSLQKLMEALFAMDGRICPFITRFEFVLDRLSSLPVPADEFRRYMREISQTADVRAQVELCEYVLEYTKMRGWESVQLGWEGVLEAEIALAKGRIKR